MLLLVLILVLIAFGLLVVALLTGSVLWAWVSVGVSVAAAAVLLVDWLQRRSAVRAGAEANDVAAAPAAVGAPHGGADRDPAVEPATEILPVVRADTAYAEAPQAAAETPADRRHDERPDSRETVVMRAFAPPGSAEGPSGAPGGIAASGPDSSHSVTVGGGTPGVAGHYDDLRSREPAPADGDPESTVRVSGPGGRDGAHPAGGAPLGGAPEPGGPAQGMRAELPPLGPDGAPPEEPRDAEAAGLVAELNDEVLVVDELPRYHLGGCPSLVGISVIPLPAREAVELGFTPCSWCTPDRVLSSRHRASVR